MADRMPSRAHRMHVEIFEDDGLASIVLVLVFESPLL
jgi:hypothetical protein